MERRSDTHGGRVDDALAHDTYSVTHGSPSESRAEEFREQEGPGDGEPTPDARIMGDRDGARDVLGYDELEARTELARHLQPSVFPATREQLVASARAMHAPDDVVGRFAQLPHGVFDHFEAVGEAVGGREEMRN